MEGWGGADDGTGSNLGKEMEDSRDHLGLSGVVALLAILILFRALGWFFDLAHVWGSGYCCIKKKKKKSVKIPHPNHNHDVPVVPTQTLYTSIICQGIYTTTLINHINANGSERLTISLVMYNDKANMVRITVLTPESHWGHFTIFCQLPLTWMVICSSLTYFPPKNKKNVMLLMLIKDK